MDLFKYYGRDDIQKILFSQSKDKEVIGSYGGTGFVKRPNTLMYKSDIIELVKQGITSFHFSEETWDNVFLLKAGMRKKDLDELRNAWDLIIDIDCSELEYSKFAAYLIIEAFKYHNLASYSIKFSGNHGFHIALPFESFPLKINGVDIKNLFPEAPRKIALYLKNMIKDHLRSMIFKKDSFDEILKKTNKSREDLLEDDVFNPFSILELDTILLSSRHLCRMVYSLNEKSGLVSIPITDSEILTFDKNNAKIENIDEVYDTFLNRDCISGEAESLFQQAFDFVIGDEKKTVVEHKFEIPSTAIKEEFFPPCIKNISKGLTDGKKRATFILINFLYLMGWNYNMIEKYLREWNEKNLDPLREVYYMGQLRYHQKNSNKILPPNCTNSSYQDLGICSPDGLCKYIKNPVNYSLRKVKHSSKDKPKKKNKTKTSPSD